MSEHNELQKKHYANQYASNVPLEQPAMDTNLWHWARWYPLIELDEFLTTLAGKSVLTICSGSGKELALLNSHNLKTTASDLTVDHLSDFKAAGIIAEASIQNAERLTYDDECFDYGFVNAGLHHLSHPHAGLCELMRIAREGVIFIENQDSVLFTLRRMLGKTANDFEAAGNYVYRWTSREIAKITASAHLHSYAIKTYFLPVSTRMRNINGDSMKRWQTGYSLANKVLAPLGNSMITVIFKQAPTEEQIRALKKNTFKYRLTQKPKM